MQKDNDSNIDEGDSSLEIQLELEKLNSASAQINELENKLQALRNNYYETLSKYTFQLSELKSKNDSAIKRVKPYIELKRQQIEIQKESQIAAARYETACVEMIHADSVVSKSEALAKETSKLDDSTMEILNIAISKVNLSKKKKNEAHKEHQQYLKLYAEMDEKIRLLEKQYKNDIHKSKAYFDYSRYMNEKLKDDKLNIDVHEDKVRIYKTVYNDALKRLEDISNNIHLNRKKKDILGPRGEGVGAEVSCTTSNDFCEKLESFENVISTDNFSIELIASIKNSEKSSIKRRITLISTTPIVDGLLKAVSSNYLICSPQNEEKVHNTFPRASSSNKSGFI